MKPILLRFKVFITRDFQGKDREYSDVLLNPKQIVRVHEDKDYLGNLFTVIEFNSQEPSSIQESPIVKYKTEEKLYSILDRINGRQVHNTVIPPI